MKHKTSTRSNIQSFPVPWASSLPSLLGSIDFSMEHSDRETLTREWLGIVSSHRDRHGYAIQEWQDSLQSALQLAQRQHWGVLCAGETPYSQIIIHACNRYSIPLRIIHAGSLNDSPDQAGVIRLSHQDSEATGNKADPPLHDRAVVFLSDKLFVLALSEGGKIARLLEERVQFDAIPPGTSYLAIPSTRLNRTKSSVGLDWLDRGVVGWLNIAPQLDADQGFTAIAPNSSQAIHQPLLPIQLIASAHSKYLIHCTRSRRGPWPDQSPAQFHDELLHRPWSSQPTVAQTLLRILQQRRLIATNAYRRGDITTVCFSSKPISDLLAMRQFQPHLARWDWEPYGIMIDRDWLIQHGAKQVSYIDSVTAKTKTAEELTFCQVVSNTPGATHWQKEQEWRVPGDVRLSFIPFSKAIVFVPTIAEATEIQKISSWPIAIVGTSGQSPP